MRMFFWIHIFPTIIGVIACIVLPPITTYASMTLRNILRITNYSPGEFEEVYRKKLKDSYSLMPAMIVLIFVLEIGLWIMRKYY